MSLLNICTLVLRRCLLASFVAYFYAPFECESASNCMHVSYHTGKWVISPEYAQTQFVAVCCYVLLCVALCASVLQNVACVEVCCSALQSVAVCCRVLQCADLLQCVAVCCSAL